MIDGGSGLPGWISALLVGAGTLCVLAIVSWFVVARRVNARNRTAQIRALTALGRAPSGAPVHRCSCGHSKGIHSEGGNGPCLRYIGKAYSSGGYAICGCKGWNP